MEFSKKPITRLDILKKVKRNKHRFNGLCLAIMGTAASFIKGYDYEDLGNLHPGFGLYHGTNVISNILIPELTFHNAKKFGADGYEYGYWWKPWVWDNGRLDFLNWLIEHYKDDTEDLTPIIEDNFFLL